jgi:hypothetical protein
MLNRLSKVNEATAFAVASSTNSYNSLIVLVVAAGAAAVHPKAAPDFINCLFVGAELVCVSSDHHDVINGLANGHSSVGIERPAYQLELSRKLRESNRVVYDTSSEPPSTIEWE